MARSDPDPGQHQQQQDAASHADDIFRTVGFLRPDFDDAVVSVPPPHGPAALHHAASVQQSLFGGFGHHLTNSSRFSLGRLGALPYELIGSIFLSLDVWSTLRFSQVNRCTREIAASTYQYRQLGEHALECLRILLRTGLATHINLSTVYAALTTENCVFCGLFGGFVFLPTLQRCCFHCAERNPALEVVNIPFGILSTNVRATVPVLNTIPKVYGLGHRAELGGDQLALVFRGHALDMLRLLNLNVDNPEQALADIFDVDRDRFALMACTWLPYFNPMAGEATRGRSCGACQKMVPYDPNNTGIDRMYSKQGFMDHFWTCLAAQRTWAVESRRLFGR